MTTTGPVGASTTAVGVSITGRTAATGLLGAAAGSAPPTATAASPRMGATTEKADARRRRAARRAAATATRGTWARPRAVRCANRWAATGSRSLAAGRCRRRASRAVTGVIGARAHRGQGAMGCRGARARAATATVAGARVVVEEATIMLGAGRRVATRCLGTRGRDPVTTGVTEETGATRGAMTGRESGGAKAWTRAAATRTSGHGVSNEPTSEDVLG